MHKINLTFDPRTKLLLILTMGIMIIAHTSLVTDIICVVLLTFLFSTNGRYLAALKFILFYLLLMAIDYWPTDMTVVQTILKPLAFMVRAFMMPVVAFNYMIHSTTISVLMSSLEKLHLPQAIVIPLAVMVRFFPALKEDYYYINNSMKMRGIGLGVASITHPLLTLEYIMVPLLASASTLGDELAAAAHTKGADNPGPKIRFKDTSFGIQDYLLCALLIGMGGWSLWKRIKGFM